MTDFKKIVNDNLDEIISTLQELLRIPSELDFSTKTEGMPFGKNINDALMFMLHLAKKDGFDTLNDDGYAGEINLYGTSPNKTIGILCHLDVVPANEGWIYPPYEAKIVDNKIFGRGTSDDKGPTIASYYALKIIKDAKIKLKNNVRIILGTDEESGWRCMKHYKLNHKMPDIGFAPDADFPLIYGEKGHIYIDLSNDFDDDLVQSIKGGTRYNVVLDSVDAKLNKDLSVEFKKYLNNHNLEGFVKDNVYHITGVAAHAMEPFKGVNAGLHMCDFLKDYSNNPLIKFVGTYLFDDPFMKKLGLDYNDYEMHELTVNEGIFDISKTSSRVTLDIRYPIRYDIDNFFKVLSEKLSEYSIKYELKSHIKPHYIDPKDPLVTSLYNSYVKFTNDTKNKPITIGGGTYAKVMEKGVAFGMLFPGEVELAHQKNEYIEIDSLIKGILIYIDAILTLGEIDA